MVLYFLRSHLNVQLGLSLILCGLTHTVYAAPSDNNGGFDHRAHAVPGGPYRVPDADGNGMANVRLNGELSHSHYFNPKTGVTGRVVKYEWRIGNKVVCRTMLCSVKFKLGSTHVKLTVTDNTNDAASAGTIVHVYKGAKPGLRLMFYKGSGFVPDDPNRPTAEYSSTSEQLKMFSISSFPKYLQKSKFSVRALGDINMLKQGNYRFRVGCGGASCALFIGKKLVLTGSNGNVDSRPMLFSKATRRIHVIYRRQRPNAPAPEFTLMWMLPGTKRFSIVPAHVLSHSPSLYRPVVNRVSPSSAAVGMIITISGTSFVNVQRVIIGKQNCEGPTAKNQFVIKCGVPGGKSGKTTVQVVTSTGKSNRAAFTVKGGSKNGKNKVGATGRGPLGYYQPIRFHKTFLMKGGKVWRTPQMTAITLGPDGKYYIGSLNGFVHVIGTDLGNKVTSYCKSNKVGGSRSILGVAFNPAENTRLRLYASTNVLYWGSKKLLPFHRGWHNGQVIAMQKTNKACLSKVETVISGLPVSNYDHAVNGLSFDLHGRLLVTIGGSSNAGVSKPGDSLGGVPDSPFSGCMAIAPILKKGFNGKITYNQYANPALTSQKGGMVFVFASGLRNSFCHVVHSNGYVYATDNGANAQFGKRSNGCNKEGGSITDPDSLKKLLRGSFNGFANRNRGRFDKKQCRHRSPKESSGGGYTKPIATFESSTDGLVEYTANTFGAQMRGDLLATKFAVSGNGKTSRIQLNGQGNVRTKFVLSTHSGVTSAMSSTGGLVMPRVYQGKVAMLVPVEQNPGMLVVTSVNPFRGPKQGGGKVTVTGWNLRPPLTARIGNKKCSNVGEFRTNGRSFTCIVPPGSGKAQVVIERFSQRSKSYGYEYIYMKV